MKKFTLNFVSKLIFFVFVVTASQLLSAQDVILIEKGIDNDGNPTLFNAIMGDTLTNGERAHPNAIYRLSRNQIYPVEAGLFIDFNITIDALDDDPGAPQRPPMIIPKSDPNGDVPFALVRSISNNSMTLKNLMFSGVMNTIEKVLGTHAVTSKGGKTVIDNCVFTSFSKAGVDASGGNGYNIQITNCIFRNIQAPTAWWEGAPFTSWATNGDTLIFNYNTAINCTGVIVSTNWEDAYTKYLEVRHNTVLGGNFNVVGSMSTTNGLFTDNLIVDSYAMGIDTSGTNASWCDPDALTSAIFPIDTNDATKMMEELGLVEADRRMEVHNNAYYWSDAVKAHWASRGAQFPDPVAVFMNSRDLAMYADDDSYPLLNESNNIEEDPGFVDAAMQAEVDAGYAKYGNLLFESFIGGPAFEGYLHMYPGGDGVDYVIFFVEWPLAENLAYTSEVLKTHSTTGGPVGDLRWMGGTTGINDAGGAAASKVTSYPNPFSASTTIQYTLDRATDVKLSVYDISGRQVVVLVDQPQAQGTYHVQWSGNNQTGENMPAGIYFYQVQDGSNVVTKRMIKVK